MNTYLTTSETRLKWALQALRPADELEVRRQAAHLVKRIPALSEMPFSPDGERPNAEQRYQHGFWGAVEILLAILIFDPRVR